MADLDRTLADLCQRLELSRFPYMVIGGLANAAWGVPRATVDIDVCVLLEPGRIPELLEALGAGYRARVTDPVAFAGTHHVVPLVTDEGVQVDLVLAALPFEEEALRRAVTVEVRGTAVRFATPEDLVLMKLVSEREQDRRDVEGILRRRRRSLDRAYLDPRVHELAVLLDRPDIERWYLGLIEQ